MSDQGGEVDYHEEQADDGIGVWWEPIRVSADEIEAELPDGTRLRPVLLLEGRRLGFDQPVPAGTVIHRRGRPAWVVGARPT